MPLNAKKVLRLAKGFRGRAKNCLSVARQHVEKVRWHTGRGPRAEGSNGPACCGVLALIEPSPALYP